MTVANPVLLLHVQINEDIVILSALQNDSNDDWEVAIMIFTLDGGKGRIDWKVAIIIITLDRETSSIFREADNG